VELFAFQLDSIFQLEHGIQFVIKIYYRHNHKFYPFLDGYIFVNFAICIKQIYFYMKLYFKPSQFIVYYAHTNIWWTHFQSNLSLNSFINFLNLYRVR